MMVLLLLLMVMMLMLRMVIHAQHPSSGEDVRKRGQHRTPVALPLGIPMPCPWVLAPTPSDTPPSLTKPVPHPPSLIRVGTY